VPCATASPSHDALLQALGADESADYDEAHFEDALWNLDRMLSAARQSLIDHTTVAAPLRLRDTFRYASAFAFASPQRANFCAWNLSFINPLQLQTEYR